MWKSVALISLITLSGSASAHEDTVLRVAGDGTLSGLPHKLGPTSLQVSYSSPGKVSGVRLTTPRFTTRLNACVLSHLTDIAAVRASASWYHNLERMPPYISLTFFSTSPAPSNYFGEGYEVTISLVDGQIIGGQRTWDPWWGSPRGQPIDGANKCQAWADLP